MRALLVNPSWPFTFWSFSKTLERDRKETLCTPLGLITLAALLPTEWELQLVDRSFQRITEDLWNWAEVIFISCMIVQRQDTLRVVGQAKQRGKTVVVGGPYPSLLPDELIQAGADLVYKGEAEQGLSDLLSALLSGKTGIVFEEKAKPIMTDSPMPRFDLLDLDAYEIAAIQTSRGCPFECEFCDVAQIYGRRTRYKEPDQVISELERLRTLGYKGFVLVSDDNFIGSRKHAMRILRQLIPWIKGCGEPFSFWTQASANLGNDKELIDLMTEANFSHVFIGIETPDEETLKRYHKYQNVRDPLSEAVHNIIANGLSVIGSFIIGFDGEQKGIDERICSFVEQLHLSFVMVNILVAVPGTALWDRLERENRLLISESHRRSQGDSLNFVPTRPESEIREEFLNIIDRLYEPSNFLKRTYECYLTMRPTRKAMASKDENATKVREPVKRVKMRSFRQDIIIAGGLLWTWGVVSPHRRQFWRQLVGMRFKNPSRLIAYLGAIAAGETLIDIREQILGGTSMVQVLDPTGDDSLKESFVSEL
jgi:radical SAM superfamily enzyme YgiQ (UPF0313 family)